MAEIKQTLNIRSPALRGLTDKPNVSLRQAVERKMLNKETFDEAWERILAMKNSEADACRLAEVKQAMESGVIERESESTAKRFSKAEALRLYAKITEMRREEIIRELVENTPDNYILVDSPEKIHEMKRDLINNDDLIAFDLETFSDVKKGALNPYVGKVAGFSVSTRKYNYYVPLNHVEGTGFSDTFAVETLKHSLENTPLVMHNAPFDCKWFYVHYDVNLIDSLHADTRIMAMAMDENRNHRLKDLLTDWLRLPSDNFDELFPDTDKFNEIPLDVALVYAAGDTEKTLQLYDWIMAKIPQYNLERIERLIFDNEMPVCRTFIWSDIRGIGFDVRQAKELDERLAEESTELEKRIFEHFGEEINLNSPVQKSEILFNKLGLTDLSRKESTSQKFLSRIEKEHPVIPLLLEYSAVGKLRSSFTQTLPEKVQADGRIHPWHNTYGAATGRFTCSNPNSQQIPSGRDEIRKLFTALGDDRILVAMDFSQIELRVLAHLANDEVLIDAFLNGQDIHSTTASLISGIPYEQIQARKDETGTKENEARSKAKTVNFGIVYGMTEKALSENLRITRKEAKKLITDYFEGYPGIKRYMDEQHRLVHKHGYVEDMYGRKRRLHREMKSKDFWKVSAAERQAGNFPIQSTAGSMLKQAIVNLGDVLPKYDSNIVLQIHDELIYDCPKDISREALYEIRETMENVVTLKVPIKSDIDIYPKRWAEKVSEEEWFGL